MPDGMRREDYMKDIMKIKQLIKIITLGESHQLHVFFGRDEGPVSQALVSLFILPKSCPPKSWLFHLFAYLSQVALSHL